MKRSPGSTMRELRSIQRNLVSDGNSPTTSIGVAAASSCSGMVNIVHSSIRPVSHNLGSESLRDPEDRGTTPWVSLDFFVCRFGGPNNDSEPRHMMAGADGLFRRTDTALAFPL